MGTNYDTTFSFGGVTFSTIDGKSSVENYSIKHDNKGNKIYCIWYNTPDGTSSHKKSILYLEYPKQKGASVSDGYFYEFNKAKIQGSTRPDDIVLSKCYNCTIDLSKSNNSTKMVDGFLDEDHVNIFDGGNNTVKAGYCDVIHFQDGRNGTQMYHGGLRGQSIFNQEKGKIK